MLARQQRVMSWGRLSLSPRIAHHRPANSRDAAWRSQIACHERLQAFHEVNKSKRRRLRWASHGGDEREEPQVVVPESYTDLWHVPWDGW